MSIPLLLIHYNEVFAVIVFINVGQRTYSSQVQPTTQSSLAYFSRWSHTVIWKYHYDMNLNNCSSSQNVPAPHMLYFHPHPSE